MLRNTFALSFLIREVSGNQRHVAAGAPGAGGAGRAQGPQGAVLSPSMRPLGLIFNYSGRGWVLAAVG